MAQPKLSKLSLWGDANAYKEGRAYRHPHTRKQYPSVTTILKMANKDGLAQWAADMAMEWACENWFTLGSRSTEDALRAGRYRWKDVRDERAEVGTGIHETIEAIHTDSWDFPSLDEEQERIMEQWNMLCEEHEIRPVYSEVTVVNEEANVMGTLDGLWWIDGVLTLVDIKTSKNHWPEHDYQLAALHSAKEWLIEVEDMVWESMPRPEIEKVAIIHLREDKHEIIYVDDLDLNFEAYLGYSQVWHAKEAIKDRAKKKETASYGDFA